MRFQLHSRIVAKQWHIHIKSTSLLPRHHAPRRSFCGSGRALATKPFLLADIGEGIRECEIIQWFVTPEARVEEWDKLCEVQSDKASVEITSRDAGVIKKLHYEAGEMAQVGKPLLDIDIQEEIEESDAQAIQKSSERDSAGLQTPAPPGPPQPVSPSSIPKKDPSVQLSRHSSLATPAVRHLTKELGVAITDVAGSGRDGRVLKEDVYQFAKQRDTSSEPSSTSPTSGSECGPQQETTVQLSNTKYQMFKTMTRSLTIPHFLYADKIDFSGLSQLRQRINKVLVKTSGEVTKLSFLPFIIKAVSMAIEQYPIINARVDFDPISSKPVLVMRSQHNIGVAIDTPAGLLVPVIKNVAHLSVLAIAAELNRLQSLALSGKLTAQDLSGGTITVSNIGNIGGTYVSPVIVDKEVAILGIGKIRTVPAFNEEKQVVEKQVANFSWCADHRVVDGATMARAAEVVRGFVENPDSMVVSLR